jgi:hypothetical protein
MDDDEETVRGAGQPPTRAQSSHRRVRTAGLVQSDVPTLWQGALRVAVRTAITMSMLESSVAITTSQQPSSAALPAKQLRLSHYSRSEIRVVRQMRVS